MATSSRSSLSCVISKLGGRRTQPGHIRTQIPTCNQPSPVSNPLSSAYPSLQWRPQHPPAVRIHNTKPQPTPRPNIRFSPDLQRSTPEAQNPQLRPQPEPTPPPNSACTRVNAPISPRVITCSKAVPWLRRLKRLDLALPFKNQLLTSIKDKYTNFHHSEANLTLIKVSMMPISQNLSSILLEL